MQYHVITNSGINIKDIFIVHLNNEYVRYGELDLSKLFIQSSVLEEVKAKQVEISDKIKELKSVIGSKIRPEIPVGEHCTKPYTCDFYDYCHQDIEEDTDNGTEIFHPDGIRDFVSQLQYPLHYMDFETLMIGVPEHDGHWPYRQVPFQYSVHIENKHGEQVLHHQYIAKPNSNPCKEFIEELLRVIGKRGSIIVYNKTFENTRLNELKDEFPEYKTKIENIQERMVDLMVPFRKKYYYHPDMQGSYSIKYVLPAMLPEYSYEHLEIWNGSDASAAYYNLKSVSDEAEVEKVMKNLFEYCKLDTLAMVEILRKLKGMI